MQIQTQQLLTNSPDFGFGFEDLAGFGFGFEHRWICPSLTEAVQGIDTPYQKQSQTRTIIISNGNNHLQAAMG